MTEVEVSEDIRPFVPKFTPLYWLDADAGIIALAGCELCGAVVLVDDQGLDGRVRHTKWHTGGLV